MTSDRNLNTASGPTITKIYSEHGPIVKRFWMQDGKMKTQPSAQIFEGCARTVPAESATQLAEIISELHSNEALALGRLRELERTYKLVTKSKRTGTQISRTKEFFKFYEKPTWMLLDLDYKNLPDHVVQAIGDSSVVELLFRFVPELRCAPHLIRASSSAGIGLRGGPKNSASGYHVYVMVARGSDIPMLLPSIHDCLWSRGLGFYVVSKSGNLLERSLVDLAVDGAERLIFEAAPIVVPPLTRNAPQPIVQNSGAPLRCIEGFCPEQVQRLKDRARALLKPQAKLVRKAYEVDQVKRIQREQKISATQARRLARQRLDEQLLEDHDLLEVEPQKYMLVGEFLDQVKGQRGLPCPIEGSDYGTSTAQYYPRNENSPVPRIVSFAHGNVTIFKFARYSSLKGMQWISSQR